MFGKCNQSGSFTIQRDAHVQPRRLDSRRDHAARRGSAGRACSLRRATRRLLARARDQMSLPETQPASLRSLGWLNADGRKLLITRVLRTFGYGYLAVVLAIYLKQI